MLLPNGADLGFHPPALLRLWSAAGLPPYARLRQISPPRLLSRLLLSALVVRRVPALFYIYLS